LAQPSRTDPVLRQVMRRLKSSLDWPIGRARDVGSPERR
jgi:hypothetical protein